jgi:transcriptional regulator GlxA family with amidase domain
MTTSDYIMPKKNSRRILFLTYPEAELLDLVGPLSVFNTASRMSDEASYECTIASETGGLIAHSCGTQLDTRALSSIRFTATDTVLVIGAVTRPTKEAIKVGALTHALKLAAQRVHRYGSICTGSFLLGAAGLLEGKKVATHWSACTRLKEAFPNTETDGESLYVQDGKLWSSAGVTAGIDMALAMVKQDLGKAVTSQVAKMMVVYSHRPGNQSQFSDVLIAQDKIDAHFSGLVDWIRQRLDHPPSIDEMADYVNMSPRSFSRKFKNNFDIPPGKFLEHLRLDQSRELIESGEAIKQAAAKVGFSSEAAFRSAFKGVYGVTPGHYLRMNTPSHHPDQTGL